LHRDFSGGEGYVTLYINDWDEDRPVLAHDNGRIDIHITWRKADTSVVRPLAEAEQFAEMATAFGREDVAALITELAALASGGAS
jgi:hypothetical protein